MAQSADQLVGRAAELGVIDGLSPSWSGEASVRSKYAASPAWARRGCSRELAAAGGLDGRIVLSGSAARARERAAVLGLRRRARRVPPGGRAAAPRGAGATTRSPSSAQVLPVAARQRRDGAPAGGDRYRTHRAVRQLLEALAATKPLVLILDDLHWADPASVELLGSLLRAARRRASCSARRFARARSRTRSPASLERATRRHARAARVGRPSADEARELLGPAVTARGRGALRGELAATRSTSSSSPARRRGARRRRGESMAGVEVPGAVAAGLRAELALLAETTGGSSRAPPWPATLSSRSWRPRRPACRRTRRSTRSTSSCAATSCARPTCRAASGSAIRSCAARSTRPCRRGWRLGAHERAPRRWRRSARRSRARAHHVERSARQGDMEAVAVLREAGEATAPRAPAAAARLFGAALRLLPVPPTPAERVRPARGHGRARTRPPGSSTTPTRRCARASTLRPADPAPQRVRLVATLASLEHLIGRHRDGARAADHRARRAARPERRPRPSRS